MNYTFFNAYNHNKKIGNRYKSSLPINVTKYKNNVKILCDKNNNAFISNYVKNIEIFQINGLTKKNNKIIIPNGTKHIYICCIDITIDILPNSLKTFSIINCDNSCCHIYNQNNSVHNDIHKKYNHIYKNKNIIYINLFYSNKIVYLSPFIYKYCILQTNKFNKFLLENINGIIFWKYEINNVNALKHIHMLYFDKCKFYKSILPKQLSCVHTIYFNECKINNYDVIMRNNTLHITNPSYVHSIHMHYDCEKYKKSSKYVMHLGMSNYVPIHLSIFKTLYVYGSDSIINVLYSHDRYLIHKLGLLYITNIILDEISKDENINILKKFIKNTSVNVYVKCNDKFLIGNKCVYT